MLELRVAFVGNIIHSIVKTPNGLPFQISPTTRSARAGEEEKATMMCRTAALTIAVFLAVSDNNAIAKDQKPSHRIKVGVAVTHKDAGIADEIESYVSRELRSLSDVEVAKGGIDVAVYIVAVGKEHVAIATTARREYHGEAFQRTMITGLLLNRALTDDDWDIFHRFVGSEDVLGQWINTTPHEDLKSTCAQLVASIDVDALQSERDWWSRVASHPAPDVYDPCRRPVLAK